MGEMWINKVVSAICSSYNMVFKHLVGELAQLFAFQKRCRNNLGEG